MNVFLMLIFMLPAWSSDTSKLNVFLSNHINRTFNYSPSESDGCATVVNRGGTVPAQVKISTIESEGTKRPCVVLTDGDGRNTPEICIGKKTISASVRIFGLLYIKIVSDGVLLENALIDRNQLSEKEHLFSKYQLSSDDTLIFRKLSNDAISLESTDNIYSPEKVYRCVYHADPK